MLKLTTISHSSGEQVLRIEGRLGVESLEQLRALFTLPLPSRLQTVPILDLTGVTGLDEPARRFLIELRSGGCRFVGGSLYVKHMLMETLP